MSPLSKGGRNHWRPAVAPGRHSRRSPPWSPGVGAQTRILFPSPLGLKPSAPACLSSDSLWPWCRQSVARGLACDALCGGALFPVRGRWALSHRKPSGRKALAMGDPSSSPRLSGPCPSQSRPGQDPDTLRTGPGQDPDRDKRALLACQRALLASPTTRTGPGQGPNRRSLRLCFFWT